jgi:hypothetical protein
MGEITEDHLEWATVDRLREMLASVHDDYKVTHTYAIFAATLCWIMQRIRNNGDQPSDLRAKALHDELALEKATSEPWAFRSMGGEPLLSDFMFLPASPIQNLDDLSVLELLVAIRNTVAHGDGRTVTPLNKNGWLVGQNFALSYRPQGQLRWTGKVSLKRADMRRVGELLAARFRSALEANRDQQDYFIAQARAVPEQIEVDAV